MSLQWLFVDANAIAKYTDAYAKQDCKRIDLSMVMRSIESCSALHTPHTPHTHHTHTHTHHTHILSRDGVQQAEA